MLAAFIVILVIAVLLFIPFGVRVCYECGEVKISAVLAIIRISIFPGKKDKKVKEKKKKKKKPKAKAKMKSPIEGIDKKELVKLGYNTLTSFRRKLKVRKLCLYIELSGADPYESAINFGKLNAVLASFVPFAHSLFLIKQEDIRTGIGFESDTTNIYFEAVVTINLAKLLSLGVFALRGFMRLKKSAVAVSEKVPVVAQADK